MLLYNTIHTIDTVGAGSSGSGAGTVKNNTRFLQHQLPAGPTTVGLVLSVAGGTIFTAEKACALADRLCTSLPYRAHLSLLPAVMAALN